MDHKKMTALRHLERTALRMRAEAAGMLAELSQAVNAAVLELDRNKQEKLTGMAGQVVGFDEDGRAVAQTNTYVTQEELDAAIGGAIGGSY